MPDKEPFRILGKPVYLALLRENSEDAEEVQGGSGYERLALLDEQFEIKRIENPEGPNEIMAMPIQLEEIEVVVNRHDLMFQKALARWGNIGAYGLYLEGDNTLFWFGALEHPVFIDREQTMIFVAGDLTMRFE